MKAGGRTASDGAARRAVSKLLVMVEMTCSVVLLVGAGLLIESVERFSSAPLGFDPEGVTTMAVRLPSTAYGDLGARARFYEDALARVGGAPGMKGVALATMFVRGAGTAVIVIEGQPEPSPESAVPDVGRTSISSDYFDVLGVPLLAGRRFLSRDRDGSPPVAIVNEALARKYFPDSNPSGHVSASKMRRRPGSPSSASSATRKGRPFIRR